MISPPAGGRVGGVKGGAGFSWFPPRHLLSHQSFQGMTMALLTHLDIVNAACALFGEDPPGSFDDDVTGAGPVSLLYEQLVDFNLGIYLFSFSKQLFALSVNDAVAAPKSGFKFVFDLPPQALELPIYVTDNVKSPDARFGRYVLLDGQVHADANPLFAMCRYRPEPVKWSPTFRAATITALASKLCLAMAHDRNLSGELHAEAYGSPSDNYRGGQLGAAIRADAYSTPPRAADWAHNNVLVNARGGGSW